MATDKEKKIAHAYNVGYMLSMYEPRLLQQIVNKNKKNDFVQVMGLAKEHHEYLSGIPKKEFAIEYRNGFENARSLYEYNRELLDKLIASKATNKNFKKGLIAGKKELEVRETIRLVKQDRFPHEKFEKNPDNEKLYKKGFEFGYKQSKNDPNLVSDFLATETEWNAYTAGIRAGQIEHANEARLDKPQIRPKIKTQDQQKDFNTGYLLAKHQPELAKQLTDVNSQNETLKTIKEGKDQYISDGVKDRLPDWLKEDRFTKGNNSPEQDKSRDKGIEPDR